MNVIDLQPTWLESVNYGGDAALIVAIGEQHELLVDEVSVGHAPRVLLVQVDLRQAQPLAPLALLQATKMDINLVESSKYFMI